MLKKLVLTLLIANAAVYGWRQGWWADAMGVPADSNREPQRLAAQIEPQALTIRSPHLAGLSPVQAVPNPATASAVPAPSMPPATASSEAPAASTGTANTQGMQGTQATPSPSPAAPSVQAVCLEAGPFTSAQWRQAEAALRNTVGNNTWTLDTREQTGHWMVYVGPYKSESIMSKRAEQLRRMEIPFDEAHDIPDEYLPGFVFGRYSTEEEARTLQAQLTAQRLKYVRVVPLVKPTTSHTVRFSRADAQIQGLLASISANKLSGKRFMPCAAAH